MHGSFSATQSLLCFLCHVLFCHEEQPSKSQLVQVYLGRWQQTDVAVKVLNLSTHRSVVPQDPSTLKAWGETSETASNMLKQIPADASSVSNCSSAVAAEDLPAMKTLEREVVQTPLSNAAIVMLLLHMV